MRVSVKLCLSTLFLMSQLFFAQGYADQEPAEAASTEASTPSKPFEAFTGKITKSKVRLRQQPSLDGPVVRELKRGDLFVVVGETDDFYAVQPPSDIKAYVFRTYVLDNVVEANRVNVRLEPDVDAPTIAQLSAGDQVNGVISSRNNKWLEISPPKSTRFYISKDYVEKIGDAALITAIEKRRDEVNILLSSADLASQTEMQKPFPEINLNPIYASYNKIITSYTDFPEQTARAQEQLKVLQDSYLQKKLTFLETQTKMTQSELSDQVKTQQQKVAQLEQQLQKGYKGGNIRDITTNGINSKMAAWLPAEQALFETWSQQNSNTTIDDFYRSQTDQAVVLNGIIEPYARVIRNKPGDYMVVDANSRLPIAFVYSTIVNLQDRVGQQVNLSAVPRNNNNFAYPAYFVLSTD